MKREYDEILNEIETKRIITIAGRPDVRKTMFTVSLLEEAANERNAEIVYFSLERKEDDFRSSFKLTNKGVKIIDNVSTINEIENMCKRIKSEKTLDIIAIDYLQLIELQDAETSNQERFSIIVDRILRLSNELNITTIIISQLCRDVDARDGHKPELEDIKKFGSLDEKSDMVVFLYNGSDDNLIINLEKITDN